MGIYFFGTKKEKVFLILDVGTEAVKTLLIKKDNDRNIVFGASVQYFERYGVFNGRDFRSGLVSKTISSAVEEAYIKQDFKEIPVFLCLPPNIFRGRIINQFFEREKSNEKISEQEQKIICQQIFQEAKKRISQEFSEEFGILPSEIQWIDLKILSTKIDGYPILKAQGYEGRNLEFKVLATFLPKYYWQELKVTFTNLELNIQKVVHLAEGLPTFLTNTKNEGVFFDVGGELTQFFLVKGGKLQKIGDFSAGGRGFSQELAERLGLSEDSARLLKERYSEGLLSIETGKRVREILLPQKINWYENLESRISPTTAFLFGGGSLIPEIREVLGDNRIRVKFVSLKDFKNIEDLTGKLKSPQYIPPLLIYNIYV